MSIKAEKLTLEWDHYLSQVDEAMKCLDRVRALIVKLRRESARSGELDEREFGMIASYAKDALKYGQYLADLKIS
jgi:hypothetical protein